MMKNEKLIKQIKCNSCKITNEFDLMTDDRTCPNCKELIYHMPKLNNECANYIGKLEAALTQIACFDDYGANDYLAQFGKYLKFDEPDSVRIAREALK